MSKSRLAVDGRSRNVLRAADFGGLLAGLLAICGGLAGSSRDSLRFRDGMVESSPHHRQTSAHLFHAQIPLTTRVCAPSLHPVLEAGSDYSSHECACSLWQSQDAHSQAGKVLHKRGLTSLCTPRVSWDALSSAAFPNLQTMSWPSRTPCGEGEFWYVWDYMVLEAGSVPSESAYVIAVTEADASSLCAI